MAVQTLVQVRRGTASEWSSANPTLSAGEWGYETNTGRYKIGDGLTAWNSLRYSSLLPKSGEIVGSSGVGVTFAATSGVPVTISITGIQSTQVNDFNSAVSSLITASAVSSDQVMDIVNSGITNGNNISLSYNNGTHILTIAVTGLTIGTNVQAYNAGLQSIAGLTTSSDNYLYTTGSNTYTTGVITSYARSLLDDTNATTARSTLGLGSIATYNSGDYSLSGHTHTSSNITDFNSSVSGLVSGIYAPLNSPNLTGTPTVPTASVDTNTTQAASTAFVLGQASSSNPLMDGSVSVGTSTRYARADHVHPSDTTRAALSGATFTGSVTIPSGSGNFSSLNVNNVAVSVSGHTHTSSNITDFNSSVSGLIGVKSLAQGSGIGIVNSSGTHTISVTGIPSSLITDLGAIATTEVIGRTGVQLTYDSLNDKMYIDATGVSFSGHTHTWSSITDASSKATLSELTYLSGVVAGTASVSRAVVLDSNKDITGIRALTTTGDVTVGGSLTVQGTTTTVNSTTVDIGDNIIRVNTSGLTTGGLEVYDGSTVKNLVWNTSSNRWEFSGGNVYTSGSFVGSLSGNASTVTNGVYTTDTGTVTSTMIADNTIVNADINSSAAIAYSKLNLSNSIVNADIGSSASIAYSKLNLSSSITNSDIATSASIAYSKLNLTSGIVNADISGSAAIAYSKLNLTSGIVNADISSSASIVDTKLATISTAGKVSNSATTATSANTASAIVARDSSGNFSAGTITANLSGNASTVTNGVYTTDTGTVTSTMIANDTIVNADINSAAAIAYSKLNLSTSIQNSDISTSAAIAYSKLNLTSSIVNSDISSSASIAVTKLAASGMTFGSTTVNLGQTTSTLAGLTSISGTSAASPTTLYYCVIDGGSP